MSDGLFVAASGAAARERQLDVLSSNLANASTDGFQGERASFESVLAVAGARAIDKSYVATRGTTTSFSPGPIRETGRDLDVAVEGDGFFVVSREGEADPLYTRLGRFEVDEGGRLVTPDGLVAEGTAGPIAGLNGVVRIDRDGTVHNNGLRAGQLRMVRFDEPALLQKQGALLYRPTQGAEPISVEPQVAQRSIEGSNVNAISVVGELVRVQRAFESATRAIDAYREMDRNLNAQVTGR